MDNEQIPGGALDNFDFDNGDDWFAQPTTSETVIDDEEEDEGKVTKLKSAIPNKNQTTENTEKTDEEKEAERLAKEKEEEISFEDEEEDKDEKEDEEEDKGDKFYTELAKELKEKGTLAGIEIDEEKEYTEEEFLELYEQQKEKDIEEYFETFFKELDEDAKAFLKFKREGGNTVDFFNTYSNASFDTVNFDSSKEEDREKVLRYYMATYEGKDANEIDDQIQWLKDGGKDKQYAEKYNEKIKQLEEKSKADLLEKQQKAIQDNKKAAQEYNESLNKVLSNTEKVKDFTFSAEDKKTLVDYITKPTEKVGNKYMTPLQKTMGEIFKSDTDEAKQKLLLVAKLLKSDFDISFLKTDLKTEVTKTTKGRLKDAKNGIKANSARAQFAKKSLADFMD